MQVKRENLVEENTNRLSFKKENVFQLKWVRFKFAQRAIEKLGSVRDCKCKLSVVQWC